MIIKDFFDPTTSTYTYEVHDAEGVSSAVIDPVLNYDPKSGRTGTSSADLVIAYIKEKKLKVEWLLETHVHADHMSAVAYLKSKVGGNSAIGEQVTAVQKTFKKIFNLDDSFKADGSQFDCLLHDNQSILCGNFVINARSVPGHTPACMFYEIGDALFVGDTLFMPDVGTARCDFPGGNASILFDSIQKILRYPSETRLFMCHDYPPKTRYLRSMVTVQEQLTSNIHIKAGTTREEFVSMRTARDKTLEMPVLILPAIQVNILAGNFPDPEANGVSYLKIPINSL